MSPLARLLRWGAERLELKEQPPKPNMGARISDDGLEYSDGQWNDEYNDDLADWPSKVARFEEARTGSATIAAQFEALLEPILGATPEVDPGEPYAPPMKREAPKTPRSFGMPGEEQDKREAERDEHEAKPPPKPEPDAKAKPEPDEEERPEDEDGNPIPPGEPVPLEGDELKAETSAELVRANLLGTSTLREYRMRTTWRQFLGETFTAEEFGFSLHEIVLRPQEGELGTFVVFEHLSWIHPKSIEYFHVGEDGTFHGVTQQLTGGFMEAGLDGKRSVRSGYRVFIPADKLFLRTRRREGDDVTGNALTRAMYGAHKRLQFFERAQIIDAQKRAMGIPFYRMGPNTAGENRAEAIKQAKAMRAGNERTFLVLQGEDEVGFVDMQANAADVTAYVSGAKADMAAVTGTEFKRLGSEGRGGSESLATVQEPHFNLHVEAVATGMVEAIQRALIEPLHDVNFMETPPPTLRLESVSPPNIQPTIDAKNAGLLGPWRGEDAQAQRKLLKLAPLTDDELEVVTERAMAPPVPVAMGPDGKPMPVGTGKPAVGKDGKPEPPPKVEKLSVETIRGTDDGTPHTDAVLLADPAASATRSPVEPSEREKQFVRLGDIERAFDRFTERLTPRLRRLWDTLVEETARKLTQADSGAVKLGGRPKRAGLERMLRDAAASMRAFGHQEASNEIARQVRAIGSGGLDTPPQLDEIDPAIADEVLAVFTIRTRVAAELETAIALDVDRLLSTMEQGLVQGYMDALREGITAGPLAQEAAADALLVRSDVLFDRIGRDLAARSFNGGRAESAAEFRNDEEAEAELAVAVRTESLDNATCPSCRGLHGKTVEIDSDDYFRFQPPNFCDGGSNCRGFYDFVVEEKA